jgi:hypothetical protein
VGRVVCVCVSEYHTDGEGADFQELFQVSRLSYTRRYISLATDSGRGWGVAVAITNGPVCMCELVA